MPFNRYINAFSKWKLLEFVDFDQEEQIFKWKHRDAVFFRSREVAAEWNERHCGVVIPNSGDPNRKVTICGEKISYRKMLLKMQADYVTPNEFLREECFNHKLVIGNQIVNAVLSIGNNFALRESAPHYQALFEAVFGDKVPADFGLRLQMILPPYLLPKIGHMDPVRKEVTKKPSRFDVLQKEGDDLTLKIAEIAPSVPVQAYNYARKHGFKVSVIRDVDLGRIIITRVT